MLTRSRPALVGLFLSLLAAGLWCGGPSASGQGAGGKKGKVKKADEVVARLRAAQLTKALMTYATDRDGVYPASLQELLKKDADGGPYVADRKGLLDPWGKQYQFDPIGSKNTGARPDVWTVTPGGKTIGNWQALKERKPAEKLSGTVSGKVTFKGKPLSDGFVNFATEDFKTSAKINADGTYQVRKLPVGPIKVAIESKTVAIPKKFANVKTSGLKIDVKEGNQTHDIDLK